MTAITVTLPHHLRTLARLDGHPTVEVTADPPTIADVLDALEAAYPVLRGTIRDHATRRRRPLVRFFACGEDLSHEPVDTPLPARVVAGEEEFMVVGAIAGG